MSYKPEKALTLTCDLIHKISFLTVEMSYKPEKALTHLIDGVSPLRHSESRNELQAREGIDTIMATIECKHCTL